jgi:hypothetical protein
VVTLNPFSALSTPSQSTHAATLAVAIQPTIPPPSTDV